MRATEEAIYQRDVDTKFGTLCLTEQTGALIRLDWGASGRQDRTALLDTCTAQLAAYEAGELETFDLPTRIVGSKLQRAVCRAMQAIPFGLTRTYGEIAREVGASAQAVGQACGGNPIPIIIPCHRVMGAKGLTGFSAPGGIEMKVALLRHEGAGGLLI